MLDILTFTAPLCPLMLAACWMPSGDTLRTAALAQAAMPMPMLSIHLVLAQRHRGFSAAAWQVTTVLSFLSLSGLLWLLSGAGA